MPAGNPIYGAGFHAGRASMLADIKAAVARGAQQAAARSHANRIDLAAQVTAAVAFTIVKVIWDARQTRRPAKTESATE